MKAKTISDVMALYNKRENTIGSLKRRYGDGNVRAILVILMIDFLKFFSVGNSMGESQVKQTIILIEEDYYYYTFADFKVFFSLAKKGYFGTSYNRIDGMVILEWMAKYDAERRTESAIKNQQEAFSLKGPDTRRLEPQKVDEIMGIFWEKSKIEVFDPFDHSLVPPMEIPQIKPEVEKKVANE